MFNKEHWNNFYKEERELKPSNFAIFCNAIIDDNFIELGCGNGRDLYYLLERNKGVGIDGSYSDNIIKQEKIEDYIQQNESPRYVYTRFLWHGIAREIQLSILKWAKEYLFIETRTDKDKPLDIFGKHKRELVNTTQLIKDLIDNNFDILYLRQGTGMSKFKNEDPEVVWIIAKK